MHCAFGMPVVKSQHQSREDPTQQTQPTPTGSLPQRASTYHQIPLLLVRDKQPIEPSDGSKCPRPPGWGLLKKLSIMMSLPSLTSASHPLVCPSLGSLIYQEAFLAKENGRWVGQRLLQYDSFFTYKETGSWW